MTGQFRVTVDGPWPVEGEPVVVTAAARIRLLSVGWADKAEVERLRAVIERVADAVDYMRDDHDQSLITSALEVAERD